MTLEEIKIQIEPTEKILSDLIVLAMAENAKGTKGTDGKPEYGADAIVELFDARKQLRALRSAVSQFPAHVLWGQSQAGKSTILKELFDANSQSDGTGSALHFEGGEPMRFNEEIKDPRGSRSLAAPTYFNPYHQDKDATGCVTRFHAGKPKYLKYPVKISIGNPREFRLAIAIGYAERCNNPNGLAFQWKKEVLSEKVTELFCEGNTGTVSNEKAVEEIYELFEIVRRLSTGGYLRYVNLKDSWKSLRDECIANPSLAGNPDNARRLSNILLWDNQTTLNTLWDETGTFLARHTITEKTGDKTEVQNIFNKEIYCPLSLAAALVDIETYSVLSEKNSPFKDLHDKIKWSVNSDHVIILDVDNEDSSNSAKTIASAPAKLCNNKREFGIFQSLIWEMVIAANTANITNSSGFNDFTKVADILDLPGVARGGDAQDEGARVDLSAPVDQDKKLFADVLKYGRTLSIIYGHAEGENIEGMSLVAKTGADHRSSARLLGNGLNAWIRARKVGEHQPSLVPLDVIMTYSHPFPNQCWTKNEGDFAGVVENFFSHVPFAKICEETKKLRYLFFLASQFEGKTGPLREMAVIHSQTMPGCYSHNFKNVPKEYLEV